MTTTTNTTATPSKDPARMLVMGSAILIAVVATVLAYYGMVLFAIHGLGMPPALAWPTAGVFELVGMNVALQAWVAVRANRPAGKLLAYTWVMAAGSGFFAALYELNEGHDVPVVLFRLCPPLLAAFMWHLVLMGDRHIAAGTSWSDLRAGAKMQLFLRAVESERLARTTADGSPASVRRIRRAQAKRIRRRFAAVQAVGAERMEATIAAHDTGLAALDAGAINVMRRFDHNTAAMAAAPDPTPLPATTAAEVDDAAVVATPDDVAGLAPAARIESPALPAVAAPVDLDVTPAEPADLAPLTPAPSTSAASPASSGTVPHRRRRRPLPAPQGTLPGLDVAGATA